MAESIPSSSRRAHSARRPKTGGVSTNPGGPSWTSSSEGVEVVDWGRGRRRHWTSIPHCEEGLEDLQKQKQLIREAARDPNSSPSLNREATFAPNFQFLRWCGGCPRPWTSILVGGEVAIGPGSQFLVEGALEISGAECPLNGRAHGGSHPWRPNGFNNLHHTIR